MLFSYQPHMLTITVAQSSKIQPNGSVKPEDQEKREVMGQQLCVAFDLDMTPAPTGLGFYVDTSKSFETYYPTLLSNGFQLGKHPLPTLHLTEKFLEHLYTSDPLIDWTLPWDKLVQEYGKARIFDVRRESWRATTEDLIGLENANHTLNHLLRECGNMLSKNMDPEYYGRLVETLDLVAMLRQEED